MSTVDDASGAGDATHVPPGASGAVPLRLGAPQTPRRSGWEAQLLHDPVPPSAQAGHVEPSS